MAEAVKKILHTDIIGQQGINLIESVCLKVGFLWYSTGLEAGIDGYIEIRNTSTGEVTNCIIQVQSRATEQPFEGDNGSTFEYRCSEKDLDYWLSGDAPVILIRSRPKTNEAYLASLKDRFRDAAARKGRKVVFDKERAIASTKMRKPASSASPSRQTQDCIWERSRNRRSSTLIF
jgi:hypothetical protein